MASNNSKVTFNQLPLFWNKSLLYFKKLYYNELFNYIIIRYISYALQFINSLFIAKLLGTYYFGIWAFLLLILQYLSFLHFGLPYSTNVLISVEKKQQEKNISQIIFNSFILIFIIGAIILTISILFHLLEISLFTKYEFGNYSILIVVVVLLNYFNEIFINIFRAYGKLREVGFFQIIIHILTVPVLFIFDRQYLIFGLIGAYLFGHFFSIILFSKKFPLRLSNIAISKQLLKVLLSRGIKLLFFNVSFYLIMISSRTLVSSFYNVQSMGVYSFSNSIAQASVMLIGIIGFALFPKLVNRLGSDQSIVVAQEIVSKLKFLYSTGVNLLLYSIIMLFPLVISFLTQYNNSYRTLVYLLLAQIIIASSFSYSNLIIARGKELFMAMSAIFAVVVNIIFGFLFSKVLLLDFEFIAIAAMISVIIYTYNIVRMGRRILNLTNNFSSVLKDIFPLRIFIPFIMYFIGSFLSLSFLFYSIGLIGFILLNNKDLINLIIQIKRSINNKNFLKF